MSDNAEKNSTEEQMTYSSPRGVVVKLKPVSNFKLDSLRQSLEKISPPTYTMNVVGQDMEYPMDEEIAKNKGRIDEWRAYEIELKKLNAKNTKRMTDLMFYEGVDVEPPGKDSDWQKNSERFGIVIPDDPFDRKLHYIYTELLIGADDIESLYSQIMSISQVSAEVIAVMRESFRVRKKRNADKLAEQVKRQMDESEPDI
jgi:hypothetical protein